MAGTTGVASRPSANFDCVGEALMKRLATSACARDLDQGRPTWIPPARKIDRKRRAKPSACRPVTRRVAPLVIATVEMCHDGNGFAGKHPERAVIREFVFPFFVGAAHTREGFERKSFGRSLPSASHTIGTGESALMLLYPFLPLPSRGQRRPFPSGHEVKDCRKLGVNFVLPHGRSRHAWPFGCGVRRGSGSAARMRSTASCARRACRSSPAGGTTRRDFGALSMRLYARISRTEKEGEFPGVGGWAELLISTGSYFPLAARRPR